MSEGTPGTTAALRLQLDRWAARLRSTERALHEHLHGEARETLLERTDELAIRLVRWAPGATTGLHDHGGAARALRVLRGALTERRVDGERWTLRLWTEGSLDVVTNDGPHELMNLRTGAAWSLHALTFPSTRRSYTSDPRGVLVPIEPG
jgi:hypothetical protein